MSKVLRNATTYEEKQSVWKDMGWSSVMAALLLATIRCLTDGPYCAHTPYHDGISTVGQG